MNNLTSIRKSQPKTLVIGNHPQIIQSILDFDYACGKSTPSIVGCVTATRAVQKFFFGAREVFIPCFKHCASVPKNLAPDWMLNVQSGRRAHESTIAFFDAFPKAHGGHIFAENVPEAHATDLITRYGTEKLIAGPSGVGILVPGHLKLGAIGGTDATQIIGSHLATEGSVAVVCTSGGMTNELVSGVARSGQRVSFSVCIGGDRFPVTALTDVLLLAERDPKTQAIVYFGELGGVDEYEIVELIRAKKLTKPVIAYIAGIVDEAFDEHMQFGHAKALVAHKDESARAKREALRDAGVRVPDTFSALFAEIAALPSPHAKDPEINADIFKGRRASVFSTRTIVDHTTAPTQKKTSIVSQGFSAAILSALLEDDDLSPITTAFADSVFKLLIDHGGNVSGAVNTMVTARAGKDLVSSLAAGLLTVGPRFGGAINSTAQLLARSVASGIVPAELVESETRAGRLIPGIGHRKYRLGIPDPRVAALARFADTVKKHPHYDFARGVEAVTTKKNGSLILNVDGVIAALFLDFLTQEEHYSPQRIQTLIDSEFFNALFVIPRSVGFIAHFMEQKENDEGLFRLPNDLLHTREKKSA